MREFKPGDIVKTRRTYSFEFFETAIVFPTIEYRYKTLAFQSTMLVLGYIRDLKEVEGKERFVPDALVLLHNNVKYIAVPVILDKCINDEDHCDELSFNG